MDAYEPLSRYLELQRRALQVQVVLSFASIERILGRALPLSARRYDAWWANEGADTRNVQCRSWLLGGYKVLNINRETERAIFELQTPNRKEKERR